MIRKTDTYFLTKLPNIVRIKDINYVRDKYREGGPEGSSLLRRQLKWQQKRRKQTKFKAKINIYEWTKG